jgi:hypothetical protein
MRKLQQAVLKHLQAQREPDGAIALWKKICTAFEKGGSSAVDEFLARLAVWPASANDAVGDDDDGDVA